MLATVMAIPSSLAGDFDFDGDVDGNDFLAWQRGKSPNTLSESDLADWRANYGMATLAVNATTVPEPNALGRFCLCALLVLSRFCPTNARLMKTDDELPTEMR